MSRFMVESVPDKCRACRRCEVACIAAHHGLSFKEAMKKREELVARVSVVKSGTIKAPVSCRQCDHAPCILVCTSGALRMSEGQVLMEVEYCTGCKLCIMACPYGAISLESMGLPGKDEDTMAQRTLRSVAVRCDLCVDWRKKEGKTVPACVEACPAKARNFVEL